MGRRPKAWLALQSTVASHPQTEGMLSSVGDLAVSSGMLISVQFHMVFLIL